MYKDVLIEVQELIEKRLKEIADNFEWTKIITKKKRIKYYEQRRI